LLLLAIFASSFSSLLKLSIVEVDVVIEDEAMEEDGAMEKDGITKKKG
jgi:hypothetical protein